MSNMVAFAPAASPARLEQDVAAWQQELDRDLARLIAGDPRSFRDLTRTALERAYQWSHDHPGVESATDVIAAYTAAVAIAVGNAVRRATTTELAIPDTDGYTLWASEYPEGPFHFYVAAYRQDWYEEPGTFLERATRLLHHDFGPDTRSLHIALTLTDRSGAVVESVFTCYETPGCTDGCCYLPKPVPFPTRPPHTHKKRRTP